MYVCMHESYLRIEVIDSGAGAYYVLSTSYMRSVYVCMYVCMHESYLRIEVIESGGGAYYILSTSYMRSVYVCIHVCMKATCASK